MKINAISSCKQEEEGTVNNLPGQNDCNLIRTTKNCQPVVAGIVIAHTSGENTAIDINRVV